LLLIVSAGAFVIGVSRERSAQGKTEIHHDALPTVTTGAASPMHDETGETAAAHSEVGKAGEVAKTQSEAAPAPTHNEAAGGAETHSEAGESGEVAPVATGTSPTPTHDETAKAAGTHDESGEAPGAHAGENRGIFGIDPESTGAVAAAVAVSLLLATAVWFWGMSAILVVAVVFGLLFAALDVREAFHQADESRGELVALSLLIAALHLGVAIAAGAALKVRPTSVRPFEQV
jgi:hypothetical protein